MTVPASSAPAETVEQSPAAVAAEPAPNSESKAREDTSAAEPSFFSRLTFLSKIQIHGFVSEGGFVSTANDYIGDSSRGSLKFLEAALNVSTELTDRLRVGLQLVSRSVGTLSEEVPRLDWAVADYQWQSWLGLRAGVIKMPLGLYNEYIAIDAARTAILLPQSVYPVRNRDALISHTGFALYGSASLGVVGGLDYQAWLGTLTIPRSALDLSGANLDSVDTKYVTGGQLFWRTPLEGLRVGGTYLRAAIDFHLTLDANLTSQVVMAGLAPADYKGQLVVSQDPTSIWVLSAEYVHNDLLLAAEYSRWLKHQTSVPKVADLDEEAERFYAMATYRLSPHFELGSYYSMTYADVDDRRGHDARFSKHFQAFQHDLAATLRLDINEYWLWKVEGHFMDGAADLQASANLNPTRYWGLFLFRTTVTF